MLKSQTIRHAETASPTVELASDIQPLTLVALGKNWKDGDGTGLSHESIWTTLAALELSRQGLVSTIIFSSGDTAGHGYSEAEAMCDVFLELKYLIPEKYRERLLLMIEPYSLHTAGNAEHVAGISQVFQFHHIALLTTKDHLTRSSMLFDTNEIPMTKFLSSESILSESVVPDEIESNGWYHFQHLFTHTETTRRSMTVRVKEKLLTALLIIDPHAKIPHLIVQTPYNWTQ